MVNYYIYGEPAESQITTSMVKIIIYYIYGLFLLHLWWIRYIGLRKRKIINNKLLFILKLMGLFSFLSC